MKSKIIGFALWASAFGSIVYAHITGQSQYSTIGVALCWLSVLLCVFVFLVEAVIYSAGKEEDKIEASQVYLSHGPVGRFFSWLQTGCMFIALCIGGFIVTSIFYLICALVMAGIGFCVRENAKKAEVFNA